MTDSGRASEQGNGHLGLLVDSHRDVQQTRIALAQRGMDRAAEAMKKVEDSLGREIAKALHDHILWPWLEQFPGLRGVHTARLMAVIRDPRRFPGQGCTESHAFVPDYVVGEQCPILLWPDETQCTGVVVARSGTGVKSLQRYLGLDVVDGRSPRKAKGKKAHWNMAGRAAVLQPDGIADHIVRQRVEPYRGIYDQQKARLTEERGAVVVRASDRLPGATLLNIHEAEAESVAATDHVGGLRPYQIDALARKIAAKAFVADLLIAWKGLAVAVRASDGGLGEARSTKAAA